MGNRRFFQLHNSVVGKEDSEAIKALGRTWHHNMEQDFIVLSAVQTDLNAALFPKNLQLNSQEETCSCTLSLGGCADS